MTNQDGNASSKKPRDNSPVIAGLFLANLTLLPVIAFLVLVVWFFRADEKKTALEQHHLLVAMYGTLAALFVLVIVPLLSILISSFHEAMVMLMVVYFILVHGLLILFATYAVARALNGDFILDKFKPKKGSA